MRQTKDTKGTFGSCFRLALETYWGTPTLVVSPAISLSLSLSIYIYILRLFVTSLRLRLNHLNHLDLYIFAVSCLIVSLAPLYLSFLKTLHSIFHTSTSFTPAASRDSSPPMSFPVYPSFSQFILRLRQVVRAGPDPGHLFGAPAQAAELLRLAADHAAPGGAGALGCGGAMGCPGTWDREA